MAIKPRCRRTIHIGLWWTVFSLLTVAIHAADQFSPTGRPAGWKQVQSLQKTPVFGKIEFDQIRQALRSEHATVRIAALSAITRANDPAYLDLVIGQLRDPDQLTRRLALAVLTQFRGEKADAAILTAIAELKDIPDDGRLDPLELVNEWELGESIPLLESTRDQRLKWVKQQRESGWKLKPLDTTPRLKVETAFLQSSVECGDEIQVMWRLTAQSPRYNKFRSGRGVPHDATPHRVFVYHPPFGADWLNHLWHENTLTVVDEQGVATNEQADGRYRVTKPVTLSTKLLAKTFSDKAPLGPGLYLIRGDVAASPFFVHVRRTEAQEASILRLIKALPHRIAVNQLGYLRSLDAVPSLCKAYLDTAPLQADSPMIGMGGQVPVSFTILQTLVTIRDPRAIPVILQRPWYSVPCTSGTVEDYVAKFGESARPHLERCLAKWNDCKTSDDWTCVMIAINLLGDSMSADARVSCEKMLDALIAQATTRPTGTQGFLVMEAYLRLLGKQSPMKLEEPLWRLRQQPKLSNSLLQATVRLKLTKHDKAGCQELIRKLWQRVHQTHNAPEFADQLQDVATHWAIGIELPEPK